jgi:hypothetical protein
VSAHADARWAYDGLPIVRLENERLRADVVPAMGGKVLNLIDKDADRNVLWRNRRVRVRPGPIGANVDDYFAGGWDDAFPTGDPCANEYGEQLPYMGEIWNLGLRARIERDGPDEALLALEGETPITPARWSRRLRVRAGEPLLELSTRIENVGQRPFAFAWGSHPALAVHEDMRLDAPASEGTVTDAGTGGPLGELGERYVYPLLRRGSAAELDVRRVPAPSFARHALHALTGLRGGWVAATDPATRRGFGVAFDHEVHRCVWQWMAYGGFRGWYHAILEPWTAPAPSLAAAREVGDALMLAPGEALQSRMLGVLYSGVGAVAEIDRGGAVTAAR